MPDSTRVACTHSSRAGSLAAYRPPVIVARYPDVAASLPTGSERQWLCWSTPAIASGCSACSISARSPATGLPASALTRQVTLAGPKKPSSAGSSGTPDTYAAAERSTSPAAAAYASAVTARPPSRHRLHHRTSYQPNYPPVGAPSPAPPAGPGSGPPRLAAVPAPA